MNRLYLESKRNDTLDAWGSESAWYQHDKPLDETLVDLFCVVSTEVMHAEDAGINPLGSPAG